MQSKAKNKFNLIAALTNLESNINSHLNLFHVFLISLIPATFSIFYQHGGFAHPEIYNYLPEYLSGKPLLAILYNSKILDMDLYQARELSYFFDFIDCKFIEFSILHGHPHFLSITTYIFLLTIGLLIWHFSVKAVKLPPLTGLVIVLLYWTSPSVFLAGSYFRSSKNGVALTSAILFLLLHKFLSMDNSNPEKHISNTSWLVLFAVAWASTLFDRQGFYFIGMIILLISFWHVAFPHRSNISLLGVFGATLTISVLYNLWFAPFLTEYFNHYQPNFSYQAMPWGSLISAPLTYIAAGAFLYLDTLRFMFGNLPLEVATIGLTIVIAEVFRRLVKKRKVSKELSRFNVASIGLILMNVVLLVDLDTLMVLRHPALLWPDVRRVYYWLPQAVILYMSLALCISNLKDLRGAYAHVILILLLLAIIGNVISIPGHNAYLVDGHLKAYVEFAPKLLDALANIKNTQYPITLDVMQNPIYQHFRKSLIP